MPTAEDGWRPAIEFRQAKVLQEIRECVAEFGFTPQGVFSSQKKREPRYYDPVSGSTWTGLGREPAWIRGKDRKVFELSSYQDNDNFG
ncbi:H-NS family nucleoid-associated regulatory protein [Burkholderia mayonis]|uniref:H-NS histone family protein n=1 Tax=Burkholderia mayonis TaxID=1385591 RepID=UPI001CF79345|nr:H-NS histone family protein [Burkholderia mayonis]